MYLTSAAILNAQSVFSWSHVPAVVSSLGDVIDRGDRENLERTATELLQARHNNGHLRRKIIELDQLIDFATDDFWRVTIGA